MAILGLHHITLVSENAQRTVDFYTQILGLRLVKQTVNFDAPDSYHLYFGDELGRPGTAVTFFEWPTAPKGNPGIGGTHHFALTVSDGEGLLRWKRRLTDRGIAVEGPFDRHYFQSIYFRDPDGVIIEIATQGPGWSVDEAPESLGQEVRPPLPELTLKNRDEGAIAALTWEEPVDHITPAMALKQGMHHISALSSDLQRTHAFYSDVLGMRRVKMSANFDDPSSAHWSWGVGQGQPGTLVTYFERDPSRTRIARLGKGQTHHFALAVANEDVQLEWRERLLKAGFKVTPVLDRVYFKSVYTKDPDGHIVELATAGPGFTADETPDNLGQQLMLPPWLENRRSQIQDLLQPLQVPAWPIPEA